MDEPLLRHDLGHMHGDDKWGHLAGPLDDLLDAKDAEIARLRAALEGVLRVADRATDEFDAARAALAPAVTAPAA